MGQMSSSCICILSYKISKSKRVMDKLRNCFSYKAQGITFNLGWHIYSMDLSNIKVDFLSRRQWFRFRGSFLKAKIPTDIIYRTSQTLSTSIKTFNSFSQPCFSQNKMASTSQRTGKSFVTPIFEQFTFDTVKLCIYVMS